MKNILIFFNFFIVIFMSLTVILCTKNRVSSRKEKSKKLKKSFESPRPRRIKSAESVSSKKESSTTAPPRKFMRPTSEGDGMVETQTTEKRSDQWKIKDADPAEYSSRCPSARKLRRKSSVSDHSSEKMEDSDSEMKSSQIETTAMESRKTEEIN